MDHSAILTPGSVGRELYKERAIKFAHAFLPSVRPTFIVNEYDRPEAEGTCCFFEIAGRRYLVTAAHVVDSCEKSSFYVAGTKEPVLLASGQWFATVPPRGDRAKDRFDFAFLELSDAQCSDLGVSNFISERQISGNQCDAGQRFYTAVGFPEVCQRVEWRRPEIRTSGWLYAGVGVSDRDVERKTGVSHLTHIALGYGLMSTDFNGQDRKSTDPKGASGGILIDLGPISFDQMTPDANPVGMIAGILIENHSKSSVILAVKMQQILSQIRIA